MPKHLRAAVPQLQPPEFFWHSLGTVLIYRQTSPCDLTKPGCSVRHLIDDGGKTQTQRQSSVDDGLIGEHLKILPNVDMRVRPNLRHQHTNHFLRGIDPRQGTVRTAPISRALR